MDISSGTSTWSLLSQHLDAFIAAWESESGPPSLHEHLPPDTVARRFVLAELVKVDLEYRHQNGLAKRLEDYLLEHPELAEHGEAPGELLYEEYHVRQAAGEVVDPHEYRRRFPRHAGQLFKLLGVEVSVRATESFRPKGSTSLIKTRVQDFHAGDQLDEFDLLLQLGKGAFGAVFLARQRTMQRLVALKVSADRGSEPQTLAQLDHPNIVRVYDQRSLADRRLRLLYMQYAPGGTLEDVIKKLRTVPPAERSGQVLLSVVHEKVEQGGFHATADHTQRRRLERAKWPEIVCRLGAQLAGALDYAHRKGVLHRDVKPANVLLAADGTPKLADFNISFAGQLEGATPAAYFGGSLAYMSPEQLEACNPEHDRQPEDLDGRSDLYSLGVLLWELLYGQRPLGEEQMSVGWIDTLTALAQRRRERQPPDNESRAWNLESSLVRVLERCLAPDPAARYQTGDELARDLLLCLQPHSQELLRFRRRSWREWMCRWPLFAVLLAAVLPNVVAAVFNYKMNEQMIVEHLPDAAKRAFYPAVMAINGTAFPLGLALLGWLVWPLRQGMRNPPGAEPDAIRRRAISLGHFSALIGIVLWTVAGPSYPIGLQVFAEPLHFADWLRFISSLTLSGLIAAAYPFFFVTLLSVRVFVPALLRHSPGNPTDELNLLEIASRMGTYLFLAGSVPMGAIVLMLVDADYQGRTGQAWLLALSIISFLGLLLVWRLSRVIRRDLNALLSVVSPTDAMFGMGTSSARVET